MRLFYTEDIQADASTYQLSEEESKHAVRVLRLRESDPVTLIDGRGGLFQAEILEVHPKRTQLRILSYQAEYGKPNYRLHMAVAPTKNIDRFEWFLEKATELGISEITPLLTDHSERKEVKLDRLNKIVVAASKQSLKAYVPRINPMISFDEFLGRYVNDKQESYVGIAHCEQRDNKKYLSDAFDKDGDYIVMIGPEGDFSSREIDLAMETSTCQAISLGEARLRTETAGVFACAEIALMNR